MVIHTTIYRYTIDFFKKKRNLLVLGMILVVLFSSSMVFIFASQPKEVIITGTVFIDSFPASIGVDVTIVFTNSEINDTHGTDELGRYRIDVSDFIDDTAIFLITYTGVVYQARNQTGDFFNITILGSIQKLSVDLFIDTLNHDFSENDTVHDDDTIDDPIDETDEGESDETQDTTTNDSDDTNSDDSSNGSDGSNEENDDTTNDSEDDSTNDNDEEETEDEEKESVLLVEKKIWDATTGTWIKETIIDSTMNSSFKITLQYSGEHMINTMIIVDELPPGLDYWGNATIDGRIVEPGIDSLNNTLQWHIDNISFNGTMIIYYTCSISKKGNLVNKVTVNATENTTKTYMVNDTATVTVSGDIVIEHHIWDTKTSSWVQDYATDVGERVQFKISIQYNGSFSVHNLTVIEYIPAFMEYTGEAMVNGIMTEPFIDNGMLQWDIGSLSSQQVCTITFDMNMTENGSDTATARIIGTEITGKQFNDTSFVRISGEAPKHIHCVKQVRIGNGSWEEHIDAFVGSVVRYNITIINDGFTLLYDLVVIDYLPSSLTYVNNSSIIMHNSKSYTLDPTISKEGDYLLWENISFIIQDQILPGESISIFFNAVISEEGILSNMVEVISRICNECDLIRISDTAIINATMPSVPLKADAGGPYYHRPNISLVLSANVTGGRSPYQYYWDLDNDGQYADSFSKNPILSWNESGLYSISLMVIDDEGIVEINHTFVYINAVPEFVYVLPEDGTTDQPVEYLLWKITINDVEGDLFSWSIVCDNGQTSKGVNDKNGTKQILLSDLQYNTVYTIWVNATDTSGSGLTRKGTFTFTTVNGPFCIVYVDDDYSFLTPGFGIDKFNTVQHGINHVQTYGTVQVAEGQYLEMSGMILVHKEGVKLKGLDNNSFNIYGSIIHNGVSITQNNISISGFIFKPNKGVPVIIVDDTVDSNTVTIKHNLFLKECTSDAIGLENKDMYGVLDARYNYWGIHNGPSGNIIDAITGRMANGHGVQIVDGGPIIFDPWVGIDAFASASQTIASVRSGIIFDSYSSFAYHLNGSENSYEVRWDFDDGTYSNNKKTTHVFENVGLHIVKLRIQSIDVQLGRGFLYDWDELYITIHEEKIPLIVEADPLKQGGYKGSIDKNVYFSCSASGGIPPYTYHWDFGDGNSSDIKDPIHRYHYPGIYTATVFVTDKDNLTKNDTSLVTITEEDILLPIIIVKQPINAIYMRNRPVFPFFVPFIFGEIQVNISAIDEDSSIERIELYINDMLIDIWYDSMVSWTWSEQLFGRRKLTIIAYDAAGNFDTFEQMVWKFF